MRTHQIRNTRTGEVTSVPLTADEETEGDAREARAARRQYKALRRGAYASIGDQNDMQYWDQANDTTTWKDHIAAVKAAHPKPE